MTLLGETPQDDIRHQGSTPPTAESRPLVEASLLPSQVEVEPGQRAEMQITLTNRGTQADYFHAEVVGISPEWVQISHNNLQLLPGEQGFLLLNIAPPRNNMAKVGIHSCEIVLIPASHPAHAVRIHTKIHVKPFANIWVELRPERIRNPGKCQLRLDNQGNVPIACQLAGRDPADEIIFRLPTSPIELLPGTLTVVNIEVSPRKRPLLGTTTRYLPFTIHVILTGQTEVIRNGQLDVPPLLPLWSLFLPGFLCILLVLCLSLAYPLLSGQFGQETPSPTATLTPPPTSQSVVISTLTPSPPPIHTRCKQVMGEGEETGAADGDYTLYVGGDINKPITVYCARVNGRPMEFLTLPAAGDTANYASINYAGQELTTHYTRIRIDIQSLIIDHTDRTFANTVGALPENIQSEISEPDYGTAVGCEGGTGRANIDLTGTPFILGDLVAFSLNGPGATGGAEISPDRKVVNITATGLCGWVWPMGVLQLQYIP